MFLAAHPDRIEGVHLTEAEARKVRDAIDALLSEDPQEPTGAPQSPTPVSDALRAEIKSQAVQKDGYSPAQFDPNFPKPVCVGTERGELAAKRAVQRELEHLDSDTPLLDALKEEIALVGKEQGHEYDPGFPKVLAVPTQAAFDALNACSERDVARQEKLEEVRRLKEMAIEAGHFQAAAAFRTRERELVAAGR